MFVGLRYRISDLSWSFSLNGISNSVLYLPMKSHKIPLSIDRYYLPVGGGGEEGKA